MDHARVASWKLRLLQACRILVVVLAVAPVPISAQASPYDTVGSALVLADASLRIRGKVFRLYGIHVPSTGRSCIFFLRPARCGSRAALALETKIQGFVRCYSVNRNADASLNAVCFVRGTFYSDGEDLAAYLLSRGLALALPDAPYEYVALERIAQTRQLGLWGFQVDDIHR